jgi:hypothetical protein
LNNRRSTKAPRSKSGAAAGLTHLIGRGLASPELWFRRWRTVTGVGWETTLKPGKYSSAGASKSSLPSSARRTTAVAVTILVIENQR